MLLLKYYALLRCFQHRCPLYLYIILKSFSILYHLADLLLYVNQLILSCSMLHCIHVTMSLHRLMQLTCFIAVTLQVIPINNQYSSIHQAFQLSLLAKHLL